MQSVPFDELRRSDLHVDCTYVGGNAGNAGDDPLPRLLAVSNMGGFRYRGTVEQLDMLVLTSSLADGEWPDTLDRETGAFLYYGDNKKPGRALHDTPRQGNELLRRIFESAGGGRDGRVHVPPILIFGNTGRGRDVVFLGLAVPGASDAQSPEDLVAVWKTMGRRFQNYRARFTILDTPIVSRKWIDDIVAGNSMSVNAPKAWLAWKAGGRPRALLAKRAIEYRSKTEQLPQTRPDDTILATIYDYFLTDPHRFEACAAALTKLSLPDIISLDLTRRSRDGGRDAVGTLRIGHGATCIHVTFALEAKCYASSNGVGVREMSRLISRLRHRQFGILVTTSYVDTQAYREIKEDEHPVIIMAGRDIVELLRRCGYSDAQTVLTWLQQDFPRD